MNETRKGLMSITPKEFGGLKGAGTHPTPKWVEHLRSNYCK